MGPAMRLAIVLSFVTAVISTNLHSQSAQTPTAKLWTDLQAKREALPGLHQEFEVSRTVKTTSATQGSHWSIVLDMFQNKWRERFASGAGDRIRIFDGEDLLVMEAEGDEYLRSKRKAKDGDPQPTPYGSTNLDWAKAHEVERSPCGFTGIDHTCVVIDVPVKSGMRVETGGQITRLTGGNTRLAIDSETGMLVQWIEQEAIDNQRSGYVVTATYTLKRMAYGTAPDPNLFKLPETGLHEVKELSRWNAARIKKQLVGKPAPDLQVTDMEGKPVSLANLKGKTVLLDFWATWCPPCVADAPSLDKLYRKYGEKDLMIVGVSVNEERETVEKFLKGHPHSFPVVLTSENEMPRPYEIGTFPTYMVIGPDGTLATAVEGDQGFGELRKFLQKAGMETE